MIPKLVGRGTTMLMLLALLSGCSHTGISGNGSLPAATIGSGTPVLQNSSRVEGGSKKGALLYATGRTTDSVYILSYPEGKQMGKITIAGSANGECADAAGDVFITSDGTKSGYQVAEFRHGHTKPFRVLQGPNEIPGPCSVDPTTGDLAVMTSGSVSVFAAGTGEPATYQTKGTANDLAYDGYGNLFITETVYGPAFALEELQKGTGGPTTVTVNAPVHFQGGVKWDGKYLALQSPGGVNSPMTIYRVKVSSGEGIVERTIHLSGRFRVCCLGYFDVEDGTIIMPYGQANSDSIRYYHYPKGGRVEATLHYPGYHLTGVVVSVGS